MAKTSQLHSDLCKAYAKLQEAQDFEASEPFRESTIQRFEFTFELGWKVMSSIPYDQGITVYGVRNVIREAARLGLIDDPRRWFEFADARNLTSHVYREEIADQVYAVARSDFLQFVARLIERSRQHLPE